MYHKVGEMLLMWLFAEHNKTYIMPCAPCKNSGQRTHPCMIRGFAVSMKTPCVFVYPLNAQRMRRLVWVMGIGCFCKFYRALAKFCFVCYWCVWSQPPYSISAVGCFNEPRHDKTNKMSVRPAKTQISLSIRPVWSESSLNAQCVAKDPSILRADSEDSVQTGRMLRLIWVFAGRTAILLVLPCRGSYVFTYVSF